MGHNGVALLRNGFKKVVWKYGQSIYLYEVYVISFIFVKIKKKCCLPPVMHIWNSSLQPLPPYLNLFLGFYHKLPSRILVGFEGIV